MVRLLGVLTLIWSQLLGFGIPYSFENTHNNIARSILNAHNLRNEYRSPEAYKIEDTSNTGARNIADPYGLYVKQVVDKIYARDLSDDYYDYTTLLGRTSPRSACDNGVPDNPGNVLGNNNGGKTASLLHNNGGLINGNAPSNNPRTNTENSPPQPHRNMNELQGLGLGRRVKGGTSLQRESSRWSLQGDGSSRSSNFDWTMNHPSKITLSTTGLSHGQENDPRVINQNERTQRAISRAQTRQSQLENQEEQAQRESQGSTRERTRSPVQRMTQSLSREWQENGSGKSSKNHHNNPRYLRRQLASVHLEDEL